MRTSKRPCEICGKIFESHFRYGRKKWTRFCNRICFRKARTGNLNPVWKGGKPKCEICGKLLSNYHYKRCQTCAQMGEKNHRWKGGLTKLHYSLRALKKYKDWRKKVFKRDNYTCQRCGFKNGKGEHRDLNAHHKRKRLSQILEEAGITTLAQAINYKKLWNIRIAETLCEPCHNETKGG